MFEREIKFIYDFNLNRVKKLGSFLTYEEIAQADLHPAVLQYISAEIDFLIFEDRQKLLKNSLFDYSGSEITEYFNLIGNEIKRTKKFSLEYLNKLLLQSSSFTIKFLVRPRWSLTKFLFGNETEKSITELKQVLNYLYFYPYLRDTLISYFERKNLISITSQEIEELIEKIDDLSLSQNKSSIFNNAIDSISSFLNIGSTQTNKIPLQAVIMFLKDKNLANHIEVVQDTFNIDESRSVLVNDVKKLLSSIEFNVGYTDSGSDEEYVEDNMEAKQQAEFEEVHESIHHENELDDEYDYVDELISGKEEQVLQPEDERNEEEFEKENFLTNEQLEERVKAEFNSKKDESLNEDKVIESEENESDEEINDEILDEPIQDDEVENEPIAEVEIEDNENVSEETVDSTFQHLVEDDIIEKELNEEKDYGNAEREKSEYEFEEVEDLDIAQEKIEEQATDDKSEDIIHSEEDVKSDESEAIADFGIDSSDEENVEPELFPEQAFEKDEEASEAEPLYETTKPEDEDKSTEENLSDEIQSRRIDISEILENKNTSKILRVIFDYDMEDFTNTIERISECRDIDEARYVIENLYKTNRIKPTSKEAIIFDEMIQEYFNKI